MGRQTQYHRERYYLRRAEAIAYLGGKCLDCGEQDEVVLQFDHVTERRGTNPTIPSMFLRRWLTLKVELDKCELVCANCHCRRTNKMIRSPKRGSVTAEQSRLMAVERRA